jgi:hypothetical protein
MDAKQQIGRYRLLDRVGKGGMAEVFKAEERQPDGSARLVAVKRLFPRLAADREFVGMFVNEARIASQMDHPNIVRVVDLINVGSYYYIVMEYLEGLDLEDLVAASPPGQMTLTLPEVCYVAHQVALGLDYAHRGGGADQGGPVVHRDITPGNVLVDREGQVKITDFGIARAQQYASFTRPGLLKGKYEYMAPEYVRGQDFDGRADLFSLGVVLYELLTGQNPFAGMNAKEIWARILKHNPTQPSELVPGVPRSLDAVVARALAKQPARRFQTGAELAAGLARFFSLRPVRGQQSPSAVLGSRVACALAPACAGTDTHKVLADFLPPEEPGGDHTQEVHLDDLLGLVEPVSVPRLPIPAEEVQEAEVPEVELEFGRPGRVRAWLVGAVLVLAGLTALGTAVWFLWLRGPGEGFLSIRSSREAEVLVDGLPAGVTPLERWVVPAGTRRIEVRLPGRAKGKVFEREVGSDQEVELDIDWPRPVKKKKKSTARRKKGAGKSPTLTRGFDPAPRATNPGTEVARVAGAEVAEACLDRELAGVETGSFPGAAGAAFAVARVDSGRIVLHHQAAWLAQVSVRPGSVFKLVTAYAALAGGLVDPRKAFDCKGNSPRSSGDGAGPAAGGRETCWLHAGHGPVNLSKALALSCNLYFAHLGREIGPEPILAAAREFGLGRSVGSDLPGELAGSLPTALSTQEVGEFALGQTQGLTVTPLQLLGLAQAVASGGELRSPRLVLPPGARAPLRSVLESQEALRFLAQAMEEASAFGTGAAARLARLGLAGKTGTTGWQGVPWRTHAWYIGFWPARTPRLALVVFVREGQGSREAAELAAAVVVRVQAAEKNCKDKGFFEGKAGEGRP